MSTHIFYLNGEGRVVTSDELTRVDDEIVSVFQGMLDRGLNPLHCLHEIKSIAESNLHDLTHYMDVFVHLDEANHVMDVKIRPKPGVIVTDLEEDHDGLVH